MCTHTHTLPPPSFPSPPNTTRFLERMTTALTRKAGQEAKLLAAAKEVEARRNEAKLQLMALAPKVRATYEAFP